jgi:hypothetical protein
MSAKALTMVNQTQRAGGLRIPDDPKRVRLSGIGRIRIPTMYDGYGTYNGVRISFLPL